MKVRPLHCTEKPERVCPRLRELAPPPLRGQRDLWRWDSRNLEPALSRLPVQVNVFSRLRGSPKSGLCNLSNGPTFFQEVDSIPEAARQHFFRRGQVHHGNSLRKRQQRQQQERLFREPKVSTDSMSKKV